MGHCSKEPHLCWTTRLLGVISLLTLGACSTLAKSSGAHGSGIKEFSIHIYLKEIRGGSVLLHAIQEPGEDPKGVEISWGLISDSDSKIMLKIQSGKEDPEWLSFQDKYKQRVQVLNVTSLRINNLTSQDSGQYWALVIFHTGRVIHLVFHLTVYVSSAERTIILLERIQMGSVAVILILAAGICIWNIYEKRMEMRRRRNQ